MDGTVKPGDVLGSVGWKACATHDTVDLVRVGGTGIVTIDALAIVRALGLFAHEDVAALRAIYQADLGPTARPYQTALRLVAEKVESLLPAVDSGL